MTLTPDDLAAGRGKKTRDHRYYLVHREERREFNRARSREWNRTGRHGITRLVRDWMYESQGGAVRAVGGRAERACAPCSVIGATATTYSVTVRGYERSGSQRDLRRRPCCCT